MSRLLGEVYGTAGGRSPWTAPCPPYSCLHSASLAPRAKSSSCALPSTLQPAGGARLGACDPIEAPPRRKSGSRCSSGIGRTSEQRQRGLRQAGPADPELADLRSPDSLSALRGRDLSRALAAPAGARSHLDRVRIRRVVADGVQQLEVHRLGLHWPRHYSTQPRAARGPEPSSPGALVTSLHRHLDGSTAARETARLEPGADAETAATSAAREQRQCVSRARASAWATCPARPGGYGRPAFKTCLHLGSVLLKCPAPLGRHRHWPPLLR